MQRRTLNIVPHLTLESVDLVHQLGTIQNAFAKEFDLVKLFSSERVLSMSKP